MKRKTCMALLALSSGLMIVFAAEVDKCREKFESCKVSCGNLKAQCMMRNTVEYCNARLNECNGDCNKDLKKCQSKAQEQPAPKPSPKPKK